MENASKALLMAGGVLAGILVITSLTIMWSKMSGAKASQSGNAKTEQLAEFNAAFDSYANETVMGTDIISLFNRVNSYDQNIENDILLANIQYESIAINVDITGIESQKKSDFKDVLGISGDENNIMSHGSQTYKKLEKFINLEKKYGREILSKLSTYYNSVEHDDPNDDPFSKYKTIDASTGRVSHPVVKQVIEEKGWGNSKLGTVDLRKAVMQKIIGKTSNISNELTDATTGNSTIAEYSVYTAFKTTKFSCEDVEYSDENGQVNLMKFRAK